MFNFFAKQEVKVHIQESNYQGIEKVIFVDDHFATGGKLV